MPITQTGRASGANPQTATHRLITVGGKRYEVPVDATDAELTEALGAAPDAPVGMESNDTLTAIVSEIPSALYGGFGLRPLLQQGLKVVGGGLLRKVVPELAKHEAQAVVSRGAAPLLKSSIRKLADMPINQQIMAEAMPGRFGGSLMPEIKSGAITQALGLPGALVAGAKFASRPLPMSLMAQGVYNAAPAVGAMTGAAGQSIAQALLSALGGK